MDRISNLRYSRSVVLFLLAAGCSKELDDRTQKNTISQNRKDSVAGPAATEGNSGTIGRDEYAVMNATLNEFILKDITIKKHKEGLTINPFTLDLPNNADTDDWKYIHSQTPALNRDTYASFNVRNERSVCIQRELLHASIRRLLPTDDEIRQLRITSSNTGNFGATTFRQVRPNVGLGIRLSRPGINLAGDQAMISVAVADVSGKSWIGWWGYYLLEKSDGTWRMVGPIGNGLVQ